ncbi:MAG: hypothetical protein ACREJ2_18200 [Planctomycetota bacterium]
MARTTAEIQADLTTVSARISAILNQQNGADFGRLYASQGGDVTVDQFHELELLQRMRTDLLNELATLSAETCSDIDDPYKY